MKLLLITMTFPNPLHRTKGVFNRELVRALERTHDVRVICPIAWTDECLRLPHGYRIPPERFEIVDDVRVFYPRFYFSPKVLRRHYGSFMWHSLSAMIRQQMTEFAPDAVLGYWAHPDGEVAVRAARLGRVPSVVMVGGSDVMLMTGDLTRKQCVLNVLRNAEAVVPVSRSLQDKLMELGIEPRKVHMVERGVDTAVFHPGDRNQARSRVGIQFTGPTLLWVGRMVPVKGLDILVAACGELHRRGLEFQTYLVGDGPLRVPLEQQVHAAGLQDVIRFTGAVVHDQLADWYRASDLMVLPSRSEGVPNVLREAMACGKPYVASDVGGIPELGRDLPNRLVPPENSGALADALGEAMAEVLQGGRPRHQVNGSASSWEDSADALVQVISGLRQKHHIREAVAC